MTVNLKIGIMQGTHSCPFYSQHGKGFSVRVVLIRIDWKVISRHVNCPDFDGTFPILALLSRCPKGTKGTMSRQRTFPAACQF